MHSPIKTNIDHDSAATVYAGISLRHQISRQYLPTTESLKVWIGDETISDQVHVPGIDIPDGTSSGTTGVSPSLLAV